MIRTNIYITERQHKVISKLSKKEGITFSEMFRIIINDYIKGSYDGSKKSRKEV